MIEELRRTFPLQVTQGEVVRSALLVLHNQPDPLEAIANAKRGKRPGRSAKKG